MNEKSPSETNPKDMRPVTSTANRRTPVAEKYRKALAAAEERLIKQKGYATSYRFAYAIDPDGPDIPIRDVFEHEHLLVNIYKRQRPRIGWEGLSRPTPRVEEQKIGYFPSHISNVEEITGDLYDLIRKDSIEGPFLEASIEYWLMYSHRFRAGIERNTVPFRHLRNLMTFADVCESEEAFDEVRSVFIDHPDLVHMLRQLAEEVEKRLRKEGL